LIEKLPQHYGRERRPHWDGFHYYGGNGYRGSDGLFNAMSLALARLADSDEQLFHRYIDKLAHTDWLTAHMIVAQALATTFIAAAPIAMSYLRSVFERYPIGEDIYLLWPIRDAIAAMSRHWNVEDVAALAQRVLQVCPPWERSVAGYRNRGQSQRLLLEAFPEEKLPTEAKRRLEEWRRKPRTEAGDRPGQARVGVVQSPLSVTAIQRMSDRQWLGAIRRSADDKDRAWLKDRILGGARQLSHDLEARTKEEPERFATLCLNFQIETNPYYLDAILMGVGGAEAEISGDLLTALILRCHESPGRPCGRSIARLVSRYAAR
jgi:hypothetical protein